MKSLLILTESFPYEGGEQFIESEVYYWDKTFFDKVYISPNTASSDNTRFYPEEITLYPKNNMSKFAILYYIFISMFSSIFWKELCYLINEEKISIKNIAISLKVVAQVEFKKKQILNLIKNIPGKISVYSYWNDIDYYAACELKKEGKVLKVFSRAHGYDCYEERRINSYMPLKRQYSSTVDKVFLISDSAKKYYKDTYNYVESKLDVSRLGVFMPSNQKQKYNFDKKKIRILSISNCVPIKRVDKIIKALNHLSIKEKICVEWVHIGGGDLLDSLKKQAKNICRIEGNSLFKYEFRDYLPHKEVQEILLNKQFDLFINTSESEGVPVSIMEAMSYSIPVIAPDVGGISDIVNSENGVLLTSNPSIKEIVNSIKEIYYSTCYLDYRKNAFLMAENKFNADNNYKDFIEKIKKISE
ncbi:glycosyltransferase [Acinetobacter sp. SwsAc3]|nr:glycosyltransferase [Acinetobacter sp. SwsAc3]